MSYFFHHCHGLKNNYDLSMLTMSLRIQSPFLSASEKFWWSRDRTPVHRATNVKWVFFTLCGAWMLIDVYYGRLGQVT